MPEDAGAGGRINARLPAPGKDRAPVALKGAALTRRPFRLRGRSDGGFCFFMPVICLLLMLLFLLLFPFSDVREELPRGTFAYTDVPTMIIRLRA